MEKKTREQIYKKVMNDGLSKMLTDLEEAGFDTDDINITINLYNCEWDEEGTLEG